MTDQATSATQNKRAPSSPAYGGVALLTLIIAAAIILTYTMLPLPGQQQLGALNYLASALFLLLTVLLAKGFRPARVSDEDPLAKPRVRSRARR